MNASRRSPNGNNWRIRDVNRLPAMSAFACKLRLRQICSCANASRSKVVSGTHKSLACSAFVLYTPLCGYEPRSFSTAHRGTRAVAEPASAKHATYKTRMRACALRTRLAKDVDKTVDHRVRPAGSDPRRRQTPEACSPRMANSGIGRGTTRCLVRAV